MDAAEPGRERRRAAVRGMADVRCAGDLLGEPADGDDPPTGHERGEEAAGVVDLGPGRRPVRARRSGMRRHDVPEQHLLLEPELVQDAVDDRRGRLGRPRPGQLPLGGEGEAAEAGAAVAGRLADEEDRRLTPRVEVVREPQPAKRRVRVLVVGGADPRGGELVDEASHRPIMPRCGPGRPSERRKGRLAPPLRGPVRCSYGCVACGAARYGKVLGKATSFEPTQSVVTKPSVTRPSSASMTSSEGLRPLRNPAGFDTSTVRMSGSRTDASALILPASSDGSSVPPRAPPASFRLNVVCSVSTTSPVQFATSVEGWPWLNVVFFEGLPSTTRSGGNGLFGMNTVLIAGRPMRSIWVSPTSVVAQTPIFESPPPSSSLLGSSSMIDETFWPLKVSFSGWLFGPPQPTNDRPPMSRMLRNPTRSKKNGSSRRPANVLMPSGPSFTSAGWPKPVVRPWKAMSSPPGPRIFTRICCTPSARALPNRIWTSMFGTASPFVSTRK